MEITIAPGVKLWLKDSSRINSLLQVNHACGKAVQCAPRRKSSLEFAKLVALPELDTDWDSGASLCRWLQLRSCTLCHMACQ